MPAYTNACQRIPALFEEIMRNHRDVACLKAVVTKSSIVPWHAVLSLKRLRAEMREFRRGAEKALRWNVDKGNTA
jgi:hypothetical protein